MVPFCSMQNEMVKVGNQESDLTKQHVSLPCYTFEPTTICGLCNHSVSCVLTPSSSAGGFIPC